MSESLNINLDRDGIVWQIMQRTAVHGEPLTREAHTARYEDYALEMMVHRIHMGYEEVEQDEMLQVTSLGRIAIVQESIGEQNRRVELSVLNESIGMMPNFSMAMPGVKRLGTLKVAVRGILQHDVVMPGHAPDTAMFYGAINILSDGQVCARMLREVTCKSCRQADIDIDVSVQYDLAVRLGLDEPYNDLDRWSQAGYYSNDDCMTLWEHRYTDDQVAILQQFLRDTYPLDSDH